MADRSSGRHRFRACLESTASYQDFTRLLIPCLKGNQGLGFDKSYVASTELEEEVLKVVFASRLSDIEAHKPTNIVTIIERASKIPSQKFLWATYKDLCEVAHPNFFGRSIYILNEVVNAPGDKIWTIGLDRGPTHRPRLLSDNGPSYVSTELAEWLDKQDMRHVRGAPYHPMTQGKIERWHLTLKNRILLENYYLPGELEARIEAFVAHYNHLRYHESIDNLTPADVYFGRGQTILLERERIKRKTIQHRRLLHKTHAA